MTIRCDIDSKEAQEGPSNALTLRSFWTSNKSGGEFARFEVRLPAEGKFRFVAEDGSRVMVVKAARRKVNTGTQVEIQTRYVSLQPGPPKRLARFEFCGIAKDGAGDDVEAISTLLKFLS